MQLRFALIALAAIALLVSASGCDILKKNIATSGPARYKSEVASTLGEAKDQLDTNGQLTPATRKKIDGIITKYEPQFKEMNSMRALKNAQDQLNQMTSDPNNAFQHKDQAMYHFAEALKALETEVRSDAGGGGGA
jgi:hypothetical protein